MPIREDDRYRNLIGGHVRTCTCVDCENRQHGRPTRQQQISSYHRTPPKEMIERGLQQREEEREARMERERQAGTRRTPPKEMIERDLQQREEEREARMERERQAETRPLLKSTVPVIIMVAIFILLLVGTLLLGTVLNVNTP